MRAQPLIEPLGKETHSSPLISASRLRSWFCERVPGSPVLGVSLACRNRRPFTPLWVRPLSGYALRRSEVGGRRQQRVAVSAAPIQTFP